MTPAERYEYQRRNRHRLYGILAAIVVSVLALRMFTGAPL